MYEDPHAPMRMYVVKTWTPPKEGKGYGHHGSYGVVANSVDAACKVIHDKHPEARIDAVNQHGVAHYWPTV